MQLNVIVPALLVGAAAWLLCPVSRAVPPPIAVARDRPGPRARPFTAPPVGGLVLVGGIGGILMVLLDGVTLALGLILVGGLAGGAQIVRRTRQRRAALDRAEKVVEACESLADELRAGQPPLTALRHSVEACPDLEPVASAAELGADVPEAFRRVSKLPGASALGDVAAAWQVSASSGGTMAVALARVSDSARRRRASQQLVASELASAQATARLVAVLPVVVLGMGSGLGADPWGFLLRTPLGLVCLGAGLGLGLAGLTWIERIATSGLDT